MFTGLIQDLGYVADLHTLKSETIIHIESSFDQSLIEIGDSICCSGVCLTVTEKVNNILSFVVSQESLDCSTLGEWQIGHLVNLEKSLTLSSYLGGHMVSGHVDVRASITSIVPEGSSKIFVIEIPYQLRQLVAAKGSIALDGVSLTINEVIDKDKKCYITICIIPLTQEKTTFGKRKQGDKLNVEFETVARYVSRWFEGKTDGC